MHIDYLSMIPIIATVGCLTRTAEMLELSPSTIYKRLRKIEEYYKVSFFEKIDNRLILTTEGEALLHGIKKIGDINNSLIAHEPFSYKKIHIAMNQGIAVRLVREIISDYYKQNPRLSLKISTITTPQNIERFNGDFAITTSFRCNPKFVYHAVNETICYFVASLDYLNEYGEPKTLDELTHHNVIITPLEAVDDDFLYCETFDNKKCHFKINSRLEVDSKIVSNEFVLKGDGIGLIPSKTLATDKFKNLKILFNGTIQSKSLVQIAVKQHQRLSDEALSLMDCIVDNFNKNYI
ncbi:LysR family transcriptional regulator [Shewanella sp. NKUCC05_KAH]|uniref:LysR family transcriptional regulator n=1 Tax=Shewanella sp. NKUCC05_KAH TaxID=2842126 RepID=UPI001C5AF910|nr:LysR family transcriptional regulator [Shewanella sp. NKUCC05_KAH]MBW3528654.1 LysR family transcriptional regulator [Shewanella sp. NKUCC05_KAH]